MPTGETDTLLILEKMFILFVAKLLSFQLSYDHDLSLIKMDGGNIMINICQYNSFMPHE